MSHDSVEIRRNEPVHDVEQALSILRRVPTCKTISRMTYDEAVDLIASEFEDLKEKMKTNVRWTE